MEDKDINLRFIIRIDVELLRNVIPTGCGSLDGLLGGGIPLEKVSLVYGEAETGKSTFSIQCAVNCARMGYKTMYVDSDDTFSTRRLSQIAYHDSEKVSPSIILVKPATFQEQALAIDHLDEYMTKRVGLVIVDTITSLYRVEIGGRRETFALNRELNRQVACLAQAAITHKMAVLITSQVRSAFADGTVSLEPVATRVLKFWSDPVLDFKQTDQTRVIKVHLEETSKRKQTAACYLVVKKSGISDYDR